jgi:hypothetical protein
MDRLREAEQQGKNAARRAFDRAMDAGEDLERRMRQKMRVYPRRNAEPAEQPKPEPIVSINGKDLPTKDAA